jgi:hypothetical protein
MVRVDPDEARELIGLIETLLEDWYVERHKRAQRFGKAAATVDEKKRLAKSLKAQKRLPAPENSLDGADNAD